MDYTATPTTQDTFSRMMVAAFDDRDYISIPKGFQAIFGRAETGAVTGYVSDANSVDIDVVRGNERIAALVPRGTVSRPLGTQQENLNVGNFSSFSRSFPLIEEEGDVQANKLLDRMLGESPSEMRDRQRRLREHAIRIYKEGVRRIGRTFEYLAAQSALTGKMPAILGTTDTDLMYDFKRRSTHYTFSGTVWTDPANTLLDDIDTFAGLIRTDGHVPCDYAICGADVISAVINDDKVQALADNRRYELINIGPQAVNAKYNWLVAAGFVPVSRIRTPKGNDLVLFSYPYEYTAAGGTSTPYMPVDQILFGFTGARCDRYFGPPELLPNVPARQALYSQLFGFDASGAAAAVGANDGIINSNMFYFDAYAAANWKTVTCRIQAAPIFATTMTDAFCGVTVV